MMPYFDIHEDDDKIRTRLGRLINDALKKPHRHPLAIFLDLNLPPASPAPGTQEWLKRFAGPILRGIDPKSEEDPWDLLVFSNQPDHYAIDDGPAPCGYVIANKFGTLPNRFEGM